MKEVNVAIAGATGAVGEALLEILEERKFPVGRLHLLASERSEGKRLQFRGQLQLRALSHSGRGPCKQASKNRKKKRAHQEGPCGE